MQGMKGDYFQDYPLDSVNVKRKSRNVPSFTYDNEVFTDDEKSQTTNTFKKDSHVYDEPHTYENTTANKGLGNESNGYKPSQSSIDQLPPPPAELVSHNDVPIHVYDD